MPAKLPVSLRGKSSWDIWAYRRSGARFNRTVRRTHSGFIGIAESSGRRMAGMVQVFGIRRIWDGLRYCNIRRGASRLFRRLGILRVASGHSREARSDDQGAGCCVEDMPAGIGPSVLSTDLQIPILSERGTARDKEPDNSSKSTASRKLRSKRRKHAEIIQKTMPVAALKKDTKIAPWFPYQESGRVRIYVEASSPVDIFISSPEHAKSISSVETAAKFGQSVLIRNSQWQPLYETITLAPAWRFTGWVLTIGHPSNHAEVIAVYYAVYPV